MVTYYYYVISMSILFQFSFLFCAKQPVFLVKILYIIQTLLFSIHYNICTLYNVSSVNETRTQNIII